MGASRAEEKNHGIEETDQEAEEGQESAAYEESYRRAHRPRNRRHNAPQLMRILNILSGVCVLFTTLAYGHLLHHHLMHALHESSAGPLFWAEILAAAGAGILSFIGGCLLLKRGR